jgi:hypothetical protein
MIALGNGLKSYLIHSKNSLPLLSSYEYTPLTAPSIGSKICAENYDAKYAQKNAQPCANSRDWMPAAATSCPGLFDAAGSPAGRQGRTAAANQLPRAGRCAKPSHTCGN